MNKLELYLKATNTTQGQFAVLVGVNQSTISRLVAGDSRPGWRLAARIEEATKGEVAIADWASIAEMHPTHKSPSGAPDISGRSHEGAA